MVGAGLQLNVVTTVPVPPMMTVGGSSAAMTGSRQILVAESLFTWPATSPV